MLKKILLWVLGTLISVVLVIVVYAQITWDKKYDVPYPALHASTDSAVIARGRYLVYGPAHCSNCHVASFDEMVRADKGELLPLKGGVVFPMGPLGTISPANLTPDKETGIGRWTDGQIFRLLRHGIKHDGTSTLPALMPFQNMSDEDLVAIVSYLRSMEPVHNFVPDPQYTFFGKIIRAYFPAFKPILNPKPATEVPEKTATKERGEYLARYVANCYACHTNHDPATFEFIGPEFAGGAEFEPMPGLGDQTLWTRSPNITPHPDGALAKFPTPQDWITRFRQGRVVESSPMHWGPFSRMSDSDLVSLWKFLQSLPPTEHHVGETVFRKAE